MRCSTLLALLSFGCTGEPTAVTPTDSPPTPAVTPPVPTPPVPTPPVPTAPTNQAPVAEAGPDAAIQPGQQVDLDATASTDPDGDPLLYTWTQTSGPPIVIDDPTAATTWFVAPLGNGVVGIELTVDDGTATTNATATDTVQFALQNAAPSADAGADLTVFKEEVVSLDGTASADPDGDVLTYSWTQISGATGSLDDATSATPELTAPSASGPAVFGLIVDDGGAASLQDTLTITVENRAPTAFAGFDSLAGVGALFVLDGSDSSDPDSSDTLTYTWTQTAGTPVVLTPPDAQRPQFNTPPTPTVLTFSLVVSDGEDDSLVSTVEITVDDVPPTADAGSNVQAALGDTVMLDGSASTDPEGLALTYAWTQVGGPLAVLTGVDTATPTVVLASDVGGISIFELVVNDGNQDSVPDRVRVETPSAPPVADAGPDRTLNGGEHVFLDGRGSSDPEEEPLAYQWTQTAGPTVELGDGDRARAYITLPSTTATPLTFELEVTDGATASTDTLTLTPVPWSGTPTVVPDNPYAARLEPFDTDTYAVSVDGTLAVLGGGGTTASLALLDVTDAAAPVVLDSLVAPGGHVVLQGTRAFVASNTELQEFTVDPGLGTLTYSSDLVLPSGYNRVERIALDGDDFVVGLYDTSTGLSAFALYDLADVAPRSAHAVEIVTDLGPLTVAAGTVWAATGQQLAAYDTTLLVSDPANARVNDPATGASCSQFPRDYLADGDRLYGACSDTIADLVVLDISDRTSPTHLASIDLVGEPESLARVDDTLFVGAKSGGVHEVDVSGSTPVLRGSLLPSQQAQDLSASASAIVVVTGGAGFEVFTAGVLAPEYAVTFEPAVNAQQIVQDGGLLVVGGPNGSAGPGGTEFIDVRTPSSPTSVAVSAENLNSGAAMDWPWLVTSNGSVKVWDVAVPASPLLTATLEAPTNYIGVGIDGMHVFAERQTEGVSVFDIADPTAPTLVTTVDTGASVRSSLYREPFLYIASDDATLNTYDLTGGLLSSVPTLSSASSPLAASGDQLYVGSGATFWARFTVDAAGTAVGPDFFNTALASHELLANGARGWMAVGGGVAVVDLADPDDIRILERYGAHDEVRKITLDDDHLWVLDGGVVRAVSLDNARWTDPKSTVSTGTHTWSLDWEHPDDATVQCFVSGGTCAVDSLDAANHSATVSWTVPSSGDHELAVVVGHSTTFVVLRDRVTVSP